jgi:hypothetical protein
MLQRELGRLVEPELLYQRGMGRQVTYSFKHALIQEAAYQALLKHMRQSCPGSHDLRCRMDRRRAPPQAG